MKPSLVRPLNLPCCLLSLLSALATLGCASEANIGENFDAAPCASDFRGGPCSPGTQTCSADGSWSACAGAVGPSAEACGMGDGDGIDNDCDGVADEGCRCVSVPEVCGDGVDNDCDGTVDEAACTSGGSPDGGSPDGGSGSVCEGVDCNTGGICAIAGGEALCACGLCAYGIGCGGPLGSPLRCLAP